MKEKWYFQFINEFLVFQVSSDVFEWVDLQYMIVLLSSIREMCVPTHVLKAPGDAIAQSFVIVTILQHVTT